MQEKDVASYVSRLVVQCEEYSDSQSEERERALEYVQGDMQDFPALTGRSSVVSMDVRGAIVDLMPSVMRTLLAGGKIAEFVAKSKADVEIAPIVTEYVNSVVVPESGAEDGIHDAIYDALTVKTGVLKWSAYEVTKSVVSNYRDVPDDQFLGLEEDPEIEVLDHETTPDPNGIDPNARFHSFRLRRMETSVEIRLDAIPRGSFLIPSGQKSIEESPIVGERQEITRSDLIARGYDKEKVNEIAYEGRSGNDDEAEDQAREGDDYYYQTSDVRKAMEEVTVYEVYVKIDTDEDGIAELHKVVYADGKGKDDKASKIVLEMEPATEAPYAAVRGERDAHQFEGHSIFEDVEEVQKVKTSLLRDQLDNVKWQNNQQKFVDVGSVEPESMEAVVNPAFGETVFLKKGQRAADAVQWGQVPSLGRETFDLMGYMDQVTKDRTGITDASAGVDPEGFINMSATAADMLSEAGVARADQIIRELSKGIRKAFKGLLRLVVAHRDEVESVMISKDWVEVIPSEWNPEMDCVVNVGLGAGTKDRDLAVLQVILGMQKEIIANIGADNPFVKPDQLYNTLSKITETAGFATSDPYFTKPDMEEIQRKLAEPKPNPEQDKLQAQMQLEQMKMQASTQKEQAQMQADLTVKQAEIAARTQDNQEKLALQRDQDAQAERLELARIEADIIKHREELAFKREEASLQRQEQRLNTDLVQGGLQ